MFCGPLDERSMEKQKIEDVDSSALAAQVVVYRAFSFNKELAIACMVELARRSDQGDQFKYEEFIEVELAKLPKPKAAGSQLTSLLTQSISVFKNILK